MFIVNIHKCRLNCVKFRQLSEKYGEIMLKQIVKSAGLLMLNVDLMRIYAMSVDDTLAP